MVRSRHNHPREGNQDEINGNLSNGTSNVSYEADTQEVSSGTCHHRKHSSAKSRWDCVHRESLPDFLKDNEFLLQSHRPELGSVIECVKSSFKMHTETWNIWTHLLGCVGCVLLAGYYLLAIWYNWHHVMAFSLFFIGAIFCLGASTAFHIFICHSEPVSKTLAKLDYCGVITLIVSSFYPWLYYGFYCHHQLQVTYAVAISLLGPLCIGVVLQEKFRKPHFRALRAGLFLGLGLTGIAPGIHFFALEGYTDAYFWLVAMGVSYVAGGVIYAIRIPERFFPGKCDIWCQSHQILHVCVLGGVISCYVGASKLAAHRMEDGDFSCDTPATM